MFKPKVVRFYADLIKNKKGRGADRMDSVAAEVTRAAALTDDESEAAIASPLFFSRLRATVQSEKRRMQAAESRPSAIVVGNMKLALSGLTIVAAVAFWVVRMPSISDRVAASTPEPSVGLTSCSISATSECQISTGDVLQLLLSSNLQELPK
jgi:hypothetical protein